MFVNQIPQIELRTRIFQWNPTIKRSMPGGENYPIQSKIREAFEYLILEMAHLKSQNSPHGRGCNGEKALMPEHMRPRGKAGIFYADFWKNGIHYQDCLGTSDRRWAERKLVSLKDRIEEGDYYKHKTIFQDLISKYLEKLSYRSVHLQVRNTIILDKHLNPFFGGMRLTEIKTSTVIEYKMDREKLKTTESTLKKELRVLKEVILLADSTWKNPTVADSDLMRFVYKGKRVDNFLEEEDVYLIIGRMPHKYKFLCLVAAYSGLRLKNVVELEWNNIDLAKGWIRVSQSKTGDLVKVPICGKLKEIFTSINLRSLAENTRVFPGLTTKPVTTAFRRASKKAGLEWASFHSLRHFCGSFLANNGIRQELIAQVLGHKDLRSTQVYTHFKPETIKEVVSVFDQERSVCKSSASQ
jgi:integrase